MSTKIGILHGQGFHLYREAFDEGEAAPVYLTLQNTDFECHRTEQGSEVTVTIPAGVARALGLPLGRPDRKGADG